MPNLYFCESIKQSMLRVVLSREEAMGLLVHHSADYVGKKFSRKRRVELLILPYCTYSTQKPSGTCALVSTASMPTSCESMRHCEPARKIFGRRWETKQQLTEAEEQTVVDESRFGTH